MAITSEQIHRQFGIDSTELAATVAVQEEIGGVSDGIVESININLRGRALPPLVGRIATNPGSPLYSIAESTALLDELDPLLQLLLSHEDDTLTLQVYELRIRATRQLPDHLNNQHKQAFITLMAIFDAAVFDLAAIGLRTNFFGLIASIGDKGSISYSEISKHGSFESLSDCVIEEILLKKRGTRLIYDLEKLGVALSDSQSQIRLIEQIQRRNLFLHNRGLVDQKYLDRSDDGRKATNIDNLSVGALAVIDDIYWSRACMICRSYVQTCHEWISRGAIPL